MPSTWHSSQSQFTEGTFYVEKLPACNPRFSFLLWPFYTFGKNRMYK